MQLGSTRAFQCVQQESHREPIHTSCHFLQFQVPNKSIGHASDWPDSMWPKASISDEARKRGREAVEPQSHDMFYRHGDTKLANTAEGEN